MKINNIEDIIRRRMAKRGIRPQDIDFFLAARRLMDGGEEIIDWEKIAPNFENVCAQFP